ncbi:ABC transporter substrate-binding protein [Agromyces sp. SYSU T00194]|uniref:ABC transporter substrate-binding protein n=1 Tax=Agromyces chitinivorans TaxID=3158560 RepID=UPI003398CD5B
MTTNRPKARVRLRRRLLLATTAALTAGSLVACATTGAEDASSDGTTITVLTPDQASQLSFDAGFVGTTDNFEVLENINATLIRKPYVEGDQAGTLEQNLYEFEGLLAESYEVSDDGLVYTFHLREGVMSEHGNELTADDVLWSYQRKFGSPTSVTPYVVAPAITDPDRQIAVVDDYTVTFTVDREGDGFTLLAVLADVTGHIYDSDYLKEHATDDDPWATEWSTGRSDFGYGAYRVESVTEGSEMVLVANPDYALGEPEVTRIVRRVVADPGVRATTLRRGDADVALAMRATDQASLESESSIIVPDAESNNFMVFSPVQNKAPFDDVEVRRAMAYAIPYDEIVEQTYQGRATKQNTFLQSGGEGGSGEPDWTYDPELAAEILADAGYADGVSFTLSIASDNPAMEDAATQMASFAAEAGFDIEIEKLNPAQFAEGYQTGTFQAHLKTDSAISLAPPYELLLYTTPGSSGNLGQYESQEFLDTVNQGIEAGDALSPEAAEYWNAAQDIWLAQDVANIFVAKIKPIVALSSDLEGWANRTDNCIDYSVLTVAP